MFHYQAKVERVVDGDTIDVVVDLGFKISREMRIRLSGVDTHEVFGVSHDSEEYDLGKKESRFVQGWVQEGESSIDEWPFEIRTFKDSTGKYGRYIAELVRKSDSEVLNERLVQEFDDVSSSN